MGRNFKPGRMRFPQPEPDETASDEAAVILLDAQGSARNDKTGSKRDLPPKARAYVKRVEELAGAEVTLVSVGERRDETILRRNPFLKRVKRRRDIG